MESLRGKVLNVPLVLLASKVRVKGEVLGEERLKGSTAESADTSSRGTVLNARLGVSLGDHLSAGLCP